jgi:hypothetical protein
LARRPMTDHERPAPTTPSSRRGQLAISNQNSCAKGAPSCSNSKVKTAHRCNPALLLTVRYGWPGHGLVATIDSSGWFLYSAAMLGSSCRLTLIACFVSWALGPAIAIGLAVHELEYHSPEAQNHSHAAQAAEASLHGHFHEDDTEDHSHELAPLPSTPSRLGQHGRVVLAAVTPAGALSRPDSISRPPGLGPEPTALAPPDPFGLCILRL